MKRKDFMKEMKKLSNDEVKERARTLAEELMKLRMRSATGQLEQNHRIRQTRRNLARMLHEKTSRSAGDKK